MGENRINEIFKPLYVSDKRYFLVTGGRASLKSTSVHDFIARLTYERHHGVLFTRYTMKSAEKSIIPEFKITLDKLGITGDFNIKHDMITNNKTGSFILFSGIKTWSGDQTANLKSLASITTWVIDEGEDFNDEKAFDTIDDSIRTNKKQNRVIWIQNPTTKEHFIYKRWIVPNSVQVDFMGYKVTMSNHSDVEHMHSSYHIALEYLSGGWVDKAERAKRENPKWYYHNYIGGWLEKAEGVVFENWIEGEFDASLPYCYALDYGYHPDPLGMIKIAVDKRDKKIYIQEKIYETSLSGSGLRAKIEQSLDRPKDLIVCDTNEPRTTNDLRGKGINIQEARKNEIVYDIRAMKDYMLVVHPDSDNYKQELNNYIWNDKKASIPIDAWNHLLDPTRYGFVRLTSVVSSGSTKTTFGRGRKR